MKKVKISCDVNWKLCQQINVQAKENGISKAKFIEIAVENQVEGFNVHKENKRLTEAKARLEGQVSELTDACDELVSQKNQRTVQHTEQIKAIASGLGVPNTIDHIQQRIDELHTDQDRREQEKTQLTEQRDAFEKQLHAETDAYNKCYERAESLKTERNRFKAHAEDAESKLDTCSEKLTRLLTRNWWERLWNTLPWVE